jgi:hypothetical protein
MPDKKLICDSRAEFLIFTGQFGEQSIEARYENETIWLFQKLMAQLFDFGINTINYHLKEFLRSEKSWNTSECTLQFYGNFPLSLISRHETKLFTV